MASSPFNISQVKLYRLANFSQLLFSINNPNNIISLPRKLPPCRSRNLQLSVYRNNYSSSSCQFSVDRNLYCYSQRNPEPEESEGEEADHNSVHPSLDPLFKFFSAIIPRISEILADRGPFLSCVLSFLHAFQRRHQPWGVFSYLIQVFGNSVEFVFKETLYDGLNIGVQWKFESEKLQFRLGKGISFYISHSYKGKAMIRNSETFIKPLLQLLPFRLKIMEILEGLREGMDSFMAWDSEDKSKKMFIIGISLLGIAALFFLLRIPSFKLIFKLSHKP